MTRRRWIWVVLAVAVAVVGALRLRFDVDVLGLLPDAVPEVRGLAAYQRHFASGQQLILTVSGSDPTATADAARDLALSLRAHTNLVRSAEWQAPWLEHPSDIPELLGWLWLNRSPGEFAAFADGLSADRLDATLAASRDTLATSLSPAELARVANDPLGFARLPGGGVPEWAGSDAGFAGADGTFRMVAVEPVGTSGNYRRAIRWLADVRGVVGAVPAVQSGAVRVRYTGGPSFAAEIATGMEGDFGSSVATTGLVIAALFWFAHRSWKPLLRLLAMLALTLVLALLAGGAVFGALNVVGLGFAAVLLGLVVDYGLVTHQERVAAPGLSPRELRHELAPALGWAAATTAGTFLALAFAGLPGLAQLGALVAIGIVLGAALMLWQFSQPLPTAAIPAVSAPNPAPVRWYPRAALAATGLLFLAASIVLAVRRPPALDTSAAPLRPRQSEAYEAMEELSRRLLRAGDPAWVVVSGPDAATVASRMDAARARLGAARDAGIVREFVLPTDLWPNPGAAMTNRGVALGLSGRRDGIRDAALAAGFTTNAMTLADAVFRSWRREPFPASASPWPTNATARWITRQAVARDGGEWFALGMVRLADDAPAPALVADLARDHVWLTGWSLLGPALVRHVGGRVGWLTLGVGATLVGCLLLTFRRFREVALGLSALAFSGLLVLAAMRVAGWSWNLMSLVAIPLLLGTSVDSTIHVMLAMRRHAGNLRAVWRTTGRALLLCAGANLAGFGSLAFSSNAGLASLDLVCALGVTAVFFVSLALLPAWWLASGGGDQPSDDTPSSLYRTAWWRLALRLPRILPRPLLGHAAAAAALAYAAFRPERRRVVARNLLPWCGDDRRMAARAAWRNFAAFGHKLADLWRYEAGIDVLPLVRPGAGWLTPDQVRAPGRGVLLVTVHLGNWEFGAPLLAKAGWPLLVLTAAEPAVGLTELRRDARARQGVRTLVVGNDPFAFVEVVRWLDGGGTVALLLDRATSGHAAPVSWCGRPFLASPAAAELARATGCVVVPVVLPRVGHGYEVRMLAPVEYDRQSLGNRAARAEFTGRILRAFEPAVRECPDQWFHFVPAWPPVEDGDSPA